MTTPDKADRETKPDGDWRSATRFRQAERIGGAEGARGQSDRRVPLTPLLIAGGAMVAVTALLRLTTDSGALAFVVGLAAGGAVLFLLLRRRSGSAGARREVAARQGVDAGAVAETLAKAEAELAAIDEAADQLPRDLAQSADEMTRAARRVLDTVAADPLDLDRARKFVVAYLPSARRAVEKYVGFGVKDAELEAQFRALLREMTETCRRQEETLRSDDRFEVEVEIDTLAERLKAER